MGTWWSVLYREVFLHCISGINKKAYWDVYTKGPYYRGILFSGMSPRGSTVYDVGSY